MAVILIWQMVKLSTEQLGNLASVTQLGSGSPGWGLYPGKLSLRLCSLWLPVVLPEAPNYRSSYGSGSCTVWRCKEEDLRQPCVCLPLSGEAGTPEKLQKPEHCSRGQNSKKNQLFSHLQGAYSWGDVIWQIISVWCCSHVPRKCSLEHFFCLSSSNLWLHKDVFLLKVL